MNIFSPHNIYELQWDCISKKPSHVVFLILNSDFCDHFHYRPSSLKSHWALLRETKLYFVDDLGGKFSKSNGLALHAYLTSSWFVIDFNSITPINYSSREHRKFYHFNLKAKNEQR